MKLQILAVLLIFIINGCSTPESDPVSPDLHDSTVQLTDNHMLWGEWTFYFNDDHTDVDVVPKRQGRFHLNALKFLEEYCADCVEITNFLNNGDGTIDLTLLIKHPFPDNPEYTGFDVKGIIMFNGTHALPWWSDYLFPYGESTNENYFYVSWAEIGDPELLNQDGYTCRWSPWWDYDSTMPIFNYYHGKYANGTPTANINAYLNFYTDEDRHMFQVDGGVSRTYHISLPPGPVTAGYAVEACWQPPTVSPVTDPANDFPITANQEEPYYFRYIINYDEPITEHELPVEDPDDCAHFMYEWKQWHGREPAGATQTWPYYNVSDWVIDPTSLCNECETVSGSDLVRKYGEGVYNLYYKSAGQSGKFRGVTVVFYYHWTGEFHSIVYDVFDFELDYD